MKRSNRLQKTASQITATRVEYVPPSDEQIDAFIRTLCDSLAQESSAYGDFEVRKGFGDYLKLLVKVAVKKMNSPDSSGLADKK